jgi:uncharacterized protein with von Willebrand factor type A (vWA) domain
VKVRVFAGSILEEGRKDRVLKETDEENLLEVLNLGKGGDVMRDDGLARDREEGFGDVERQRAETRAARGSADEDDGLGMHSCDGCWRFKKKGRMCKS